ncbi:hypothetical protein DPX16_16952 [Anabarilius grahami]|uniref:Uncharacterized protein n=1 Tax=Anabarilius grahami TaxID=495550 RepID=A0A3N0XCJ6_ANAGA|nr:hypothetical protein DPX16_16952 [Anabarilius grahami]
MGWVESSRKTPDTVIQMDLEGHRFGVTHSDRFEPRAFCDLWSTASQFLLRHIVHVSPPEIWWIAMSSGPREESNRFPAAT